MSSRSESDKSGAIFTSTGVEVSARTADRMGRSDSDRLQIPRNPGVFGELTLTADTAAGRPSELVGSR